jgi:hypothetical protein
MIWHILGIASLFLIENTDKLVRDNSELISINSFNISINAVTYHKIFTHKPKEQKPNSYVEENLWLFE